MLSLEQVAWGAGRLGARHCLLIYCRHKNIESRDVREIIGGEVTSETFSDVEHSMDEVGAFLLRSRGGKFLACDFRPPYTSLPILGPAFPLRGL
jgi:hypothetical protein